MKLLPFDYAVRNLGRSPVRLMALVAGHMLVVMLVLAAASFVRGMQASLGGGGSQHHVLLLSAGSEESIERSQIDAGTVGVIRASLPHVRRSGGEPHLSPEVLTSLIVRTGKDSPSELRAMLRGITPGAFLVHERVEIIEGRAPVDGRNELLVGNLADAMLGLPARRLEPGNSLWFDGHEWLIVGRFRAANSVMQGEIWTSLRDLQVATRREAVSCVVVELTEPEAFADIDMFAKMRVDLELAAVRETTYYGALQQFYRPVRWMIWATACMAALAGVLGGLNTMYAAFAARIRELGMLQALGYPRRAIIISLVQESLLTAAVASLLACALGAWLMQGVAVRFSMGVLELRPDAPALMLAAGIGLLLGVFGALPPALRCLRAAIPQALKAV